LQRVRIFAVKLNAEDTDMRGRKMDAVIEAVHYAADGKIEFVRLYERRGATWSDALVVGREALVELLGKRKYLVTGTRKAHLGSMFEAGEAVQLDGRSIITPGQPQNKDSLAGVPII
jgi:hypothetical protein